MLRAGVGAGSSSSSAARRAGRLRCIRKFATEAGSAPPPPKKRGIVRRLVLYSTILTTTFYAGSTLVAFNHDRFHDFFMESVPLGERITEYLEDCSYDKYIRLPARYRIKTRETYQQIENTVTGRDIPPASTSPSPAKGEVSLKEKQPKSSQDMTKESRPVRNAVQKGKERLAQVTDTLTTKVEQATDVVKGQSKGAIATSRHQLAQFSEGVEELIREAEDALSGKHSTLEIETAAVTNQKVASSAPEASSSKDGALLYTRPLPAGFEAPPGYSLPAKSKPGSSRTAKKDDGNGSSLPLVAPSVSALPNTEPILNHLASTIDELSAFLRDNPSAVTGGAKDVLENAKQDLAGLATHLEKVQNDAADKLEEQAREHSLRLLEAELEAQTKTDAIEDDWRQHYEEERHKIIDAYRAKLDHELQTQSEIINERLKEEVVAQGIELQRRWIRDIKVQVEQERGGRLSKLEKLASDLKKLESVALSTDAHLDENLRLHTLWSSLRAVASTSVDSTTRKPFREQLRRLRHTAAVREDPLMSNALDALDASAVPDVGVDPLQDLSAWLSSAVVPRVSRVALVPDSNAGVLSHLASHLLTSFRVRPNILGREAIDGNDVLSILARAEQFMSEKDLDGAARALNQLKGTPKLLVHDWLEAARRRLEVAQALEVIQSQATLASLLVSQ